MKLRLTRLMTLMVKIQKKQISLNVNQSLKNYFRNMNSIARRRVFCLRVTILDLTFTLKRFKSFLVTISVLTLLVIRITLTILRDLQTLIQTLASLHVTTLLIQLIKARHLLKYKQMKLRMTRELGLSAQWLTNMLSLMLLLSV